MMVFKANSVEGVSETEDAMEIFPPAFNVKVRAAVNAGEMAASMMISLVA